MHTAHADDSIIARRANTIRSPAAKTAKVSYMIHEHLLEDAHLHTVLGFDMTTRIQRFTLHSGPLPLFASSHFVFCITTMSKQYFLALTTLTTQIISSSTAPLSLPTAEVNDVMIMMAMAMMNTNYRYTRTGVYTFCLI